jgi:hypothetical protein
MASRNIALKIFEVCIETMQTTWHRAREFLALMTHCAEGVQNENINPIVSIVMS